MSKIKLDGDKVEFMSAQCPCLKLMPVQVMLRRSLDNRYFTGYCPKCNKQLIEMVGQPL